jgi:homoserine kinase
MYRVRVTIPATSSNLGPGLDSMALALGLHNVIEVGEIEQGLEFQLHGEGVDRLPRDPSNLIVRAATCVFRRVGYAPSGLHVRLESNIPPCCGLGSSTTALLGGIVAANVLLGSPLSREDVLRLAVKMEGRPNAVTAALLGGLVVSNMDDGVLSYAGVPVAPMEVVVVLPRLPSDRARVVLPPSVSLADAVSNVGRAALVMHALATGDFDLLARAMHDRLHEPTRSQEIPGFEQAVRAARRYGAAVAISGSGPALIAFVPSEHDRVASAMVRALHSAGKMTARAWILPIDRQGVSISEMGTDFARTRPLPTPASPYPALRFVKDFHEEAAGDDSPSASVSPHPGLSPSNGKESRDEREEYSRP